MNHCWHETGISKKINPPQFEDVCCHCNKRRWRIESNIGHGRFFPRKNTLPGSIKETRPFDDEECVARVVEVAV
jgi:hypothetical protein